MCKILGRVPTLPRWRVLTICSASQLHSHLPLLVLQSPFTLRLWSDWAASHLVCSSLFVSLMDTFASRPLHAANNSASEMVRSQQMFFYLCPQLLPPLLALLHLLSLWGSLGSWRAVINHFLPVFPQKLTTTAALFFTLRCVYLTAAFCSHFHFLLCSTRAKASTWTLLSSLWSLSCDGFTVCTHELEMTEGRAGVWAGGLFYQTLLKSSISSVWYK